MQNTVTKLAVCPVCSSYVNHQYFMQDAKTKKTSRWHSCACGVVFQSEKPANVYDRAYWDKFAAHDAKLKDAYQYPVRLYAPILEELVYGRKVLLVGKETPHQEDAFTKRGWVAYSIDKNPVHTPSDRMFVGDFESYEFPEDSKFSLIWLYGTLECFLDPISALSKARSLLTDDGILFIGSPDTDFINTRSSSAFIHWKPDMHYLMWNKRSLNRHLESLGFNVILARSNYEGRFPAWDDLHMIAQRKFF
jgi:hypothetical protein